MSARQDEWELEGEELLGGPNGHGLPAAAASPRTLRRVGPAAARSALAAGATALAAAELEAEYEGEYEGEAEYEYEGEQEGEHRLSPVRRVYADALMEHFGHAAAETESEAEAEAFIGALVPLAARLLPRVAPTIMRAAPGLIRGVAGITRTLRRNPQTRPLVRALPTIVRRTVADLGRQGTSGRPVTVEGAMRTLARQTRGVLSQPHRCQAALRRSAAADRRFHRVARAQPRRVAI
jgi:hypothetical protein